MVANNIYSRASRRTGILYRTWFTTRRRKSRRAKTRGERNSLLLRFFVTGEYFSLSLSLTRVQAARKNSTPIDIPCHVLTRAGRWYGGCIEGAKTSRCGGTCRQRKHIPSIRCVDIFVRTLCGCNVNPCEYSRISVDLIPPSPRRTGRTLAVMEFDIRIDTGDALPALTREERIQTAAKEDEWLLSRISAVVKNSTWIHSTLYCNNWRRARAWICTEKRRKMQRKDDAASIYDINYVDKNILPHFYYGVWRERLKS